MFGVSSFEPYTSIMLILYIHFVIWSGILLSKMAIMRYNDKLGTLKNYTSLCEFTFLIAQVVGVSIPGKIIEQKLTYLGPFQPF